MLNHERRHGAAQARRGSALARRAAARGTAPVEARLLYLPGCPLAERVRATLRECLADAGVPVQVEEVEGSFPSPTLLVGGADVVTGTAVTGTAVTGTAVARAAGTGEPCCRLDLPTRTQILAAIHRERAIHDA